MKSKSILLSCTMLLFSAGIFAQANFAGTWALNESKSKFGDSQFRMAATSMVVTQDASSLSVQSTQPGFDGGEMKTSAKYNLDGSVSSNTGFMDSQQKSTVAWSADKTALTITTTMSFDMGEFKSVQVWKLSDGGKTLLVESSMPGPDGDMKTTAGYDKK